MQLVAAKKMEAKLKNAEKLTQELHQTHADIQARTRTHAYIHDMNE